jgi:hypothetical protein
MQVSDRVDGLFQWSISSYLQTPVSLVLVAAADHMDGLLEESCGARRRRDAAFLHERRRHKRRRLPEPLLEVHLRHQHLLVAVHSWGENRLRPQQSSDTNCNCCVSSETHRHRQQPPPATRPWRASASCGQSTGSSRTSPSWASWGPWAGCSRRAPAAGTRTLFRRTPDPGCRPAPSC